MRSFGPLLPLVTIWLALAGCGRSGLGLDVTTDGDRTGGEGGGPSVTTSNAAPSTAGAGGTAVTSSVPTGAGNTATGGAGGAPVVACGSAEVAKPILLIDDAAADLARPSVVALDGDPPRAAVVFARQQVPMTAGPTMRVASFAGWSAWPPSAPAFVDMDDPYNPGGRLPADSFLATSRRAPPAASFGLLYRDTSAGYCMLAEGATLDGTLGTHGKTGVGDALFLSPNEHHDHVLGGVVEQRPDGLFALGLSLTFELGQVNDIGLGCAATPIAADAVPAPAGKGWLVAAALGASAAWNGGPGTCGPTDAVGPATTIELSYVTPSGQSSGWVPPLEMPATVTRIRMAPRSDGAWVVWSLEGQGSLSGARVLPSDELGAPFEILAGAGALDPTSFDVEPLDDGLVIAAVERQDGAPDRIELTALDAAGSHLWSTPVATEGAVDGPLSLIVAPDASALLLAWSERPAGGSARRLRVARIACLEGPGGP